MATTLNLANEHIKLLKGDNEDLKRKKRDLERRLRDHEQADQDRRFKELADSRDKQLHEANAQGKKLLDQSEDRMKKLEQKLVAANRKLDEKQMLKLGADEYVCCRFDCPRIRLSTCSCTLTRHLTGSA